MRVQAWHINSLCIIMQMIEILCQHLTQPLNWSAGLHNKSRLLDLFCVSSWTYKCLLSYQTDMGKPKSNCLGAKENIFWEPKKKDRSTSHSNLISCITFLNIALCVQSHCSFTQNVFYSLSTEGNMLDFAAFVCNWQTY